MRPRAVTGSARNRRPLSVTCDRPGGNHLGTSAGLLDTASNATRGDDDCAWAAPLRKLSTTSSSTPPADQAAEARLNPRRRGMSASYRLRLYQRSATS